MEEGHGKFGKIRLMHNDLVVNPYLKLHHYSPDRAVMLFSAPKQGSGLQTFEIIKDETPHLFEVLVDVGNARFDFIDPQMDLSDVERRDLESKGFLVPSTAVPSMPLFECTFEDIDAFTGEIGVEQLIVNPTFRFEPFDLLKFATWAREKHLSPSKPTAWIKTPVTDIELGFWLAPNEADVLDQFIPSQPLYQDINEDLKRKLIAAEILIQPRAYKQRCDLLTNVTNVAAREHDSQKYSVIKDLLPSAHMRALARYYRQYVGEGFMQMGDVQVARRYQEHNEPLAAFLQPHFKKVISDLVGDEVKSSYVYSATYIEGAELLPHVDREQCEYSISFQVDYEPEPSDGVSPWPLFVEPFHMDGGTPAEGIIFDWANKDHRKDGNATAVHLANGDGLFYRGRDLLHYRHSLPTGHRSTSLFFHFVSTTFDGELE